MFGGLVLQGKKSMIKNLTILLVEDDDVAAESVMRSLRKVEPAIKVNWKQNGQLALDALREQDQSGRIAEPYLVLLDLNMPVMNGFEFLEQIRLDKKLHDTVVFILSTSNEDSDRTRAYHNNVAGYMVKSSIGPQFAKLAKLMDAYMNATELT